MLLTNQNNELKKTLKKLKSIKDPQSPIDVDYEDINSNTKDDFK